MEQNEDIKKLIAFGKGEIEQGEEMDRLRKIKVQHRIDESWISFCTRVKHDFPQYLLDALNFEDIDMRDVAPNLFCQTIGYVKLIIDGLAPIYLLFDKSNQLKAFVVPALNYDLQWITGLNANYWMHGTKAIETLDLSYALAMAERHYKIWVEKKSKQKKVDAPPVKEPVYVPVIENTADAQAMSAIRAIIREEIHRLAFSD